MAQRLRPYRGVFHSFHKRWGAITGPGREAESAHSRARELPGEFVSDELRDDCARFLDELRTMIHRRGEAEVEGADWVPANAKPG